jgi:NAD(P)-dependent dehydrogenase (short-subunit alcohol dehydrogenase family)
MNKKNVVVTGAYGKIGYAICRSMASIPGYRLTLAGRNEEALQAACASLISSSGNTDISYYRLDLSLFSQIRDFAAQWQGPLHIIINNAATCPRSRQENAEGIEMQFATNVLGYYRIIKAFAPILKASAPARVVNVASYWAGDLDLSDLEFKRRHYDNNTAYRQSKQADRMLSAAFAEEFRFSGISVNACHPGDVNSGLSNSLGFGGHETPGEGAATPVWLATSAETEGSSGKYFENMREQRCPFSENIENRRALMRFCSSCQPDF